MADLYRDFVFTRCTVQVTDTDTTIQVEDVSLFPSNAVLAKGEFFIAFDSTLTYPHFFEIVRLVSVNTATKTLTVVRAQAGTAAVPHPIVTYIKGTLNADQVERVRSGERGTTAPAPDSDVFNPGDRFYHLTEGRFYAFTGNASFLRDTFTRAASATTMGSTEVQTVVGESNGVLAPQFSQVVPYVVPWVPSGTNIFGINASNQAYLVSGVAGANSMVNVGSPNFDVTLDVFMTSTAGSDYGIFFRVDADQKYGYYLQFLGTTVSLFRLVNGTFTAIAGQTSTYTAGAIRSWRVWVDGNIIRILRTNTNGISEQVINYTETTAGFLVGNAIYRPGAHVGIRYGNAAAVTDATIVWDAFTCTTPDNVGLNNPKPQGWAPVSSLLGPLDTSGYTMRQLAKLESDLSSLAVWTEDFVDITRGLETSQAQQSRDIATMGLHLDEWLDTYKSEPPLEPFLGTFAGMAASLDEVIDVLSRLVTSGSGNPAGTPRDGEVYVDTATKTIWAGVASVWTRVSYAGPNAVIPNIQYVGTSTSSSSTGTYPAGTAAGDLVIALHNTANTSDGNIFAPSGWTRVAASNPVSQYYNAYSLAYKIVTQADINAGTFAFSSGTSGNTQTKTRVYRNANWGAFVSNQQANANNTTITGPTIATTVGQTVVNWFSSANNNHNPVFLDPQQSNAQRLAQGFAWQLSSDELATGTTSTARQVRWTTGDNSTAWAWFTITLTSTGEIIPAPGAAFITGAPTGTAVAGSIRIDQASNSAFVYNGTEWVGLNRRLVIAKSDYTAKPGDYVLADATQSRGSNLSEINADTEVASSANPHTITLVTTTGNCLIVGIRASWSGSGFSATLNGASMTKRQRVVNFNGGSHSDLFTSDTLVAAGTQTLVFSGATAAAIGWSSALAIANGQTAGATYAGITNANNLSFTLPATGPGFVVVYAQRNSSPRPVMTSGGTLTFTDRGGFPHGSENSSTWWTAPYTAAMVGQTVSLTFSPNDTTWGHTQVACFPGGTGVYIFEASNFVNITLPAPAQGAQVSVQSNDAVSNEVRVLTASGLVNGSAQDILATRYVGGIYTSDGTNWFKLGAGGGGGSSATVVSRAVNYTAKSGEIVLMDASGGARTVTLPGAALNVTVTVKKTDSSANAVTITPASGLIDGQASVSVIQQYDSYDLVSDGTNWWLI